MGADERTHTAGTLLLMAGALAIIGNLAHPLFDGDTAAEEILEVAGAPLWLPVHLVIGVSIVVAIFGLRALADALADTTGAVLARAGALTGTIGGSIFIVQIVALDGVMNARLASALEAAPASDRGALLVVAEQLQMLDLSILSVAVMLFLGLAVGLAAVALMRADRCPAWARWVGLVGAAGCGLAGLLLALLGPSDVSILYLFRPASAVVTIGLLAVGWSLRRQTLPAPEAPAATPA